MAIARITAPNARLLIDVSRHFPAASSYQQQRIAEALDRTFRVPVLLEEPLGRVVFDTINAPA